MEGEKCDRFRQQLSEDRIAVLKDKGWLTIDGFFGPAWSEALSQELRWLQSEGLMLPNKTQFGLPNGSVLVTQKPNIYEVDLHNEDIRKRKQLVEMERIFNQDVLVDVFNERLPELRLKQGTNGKTVKLQYNAGSGGCFPVHYDNPGKPNKRMLTCLVYLNPGWVEGDGGELQLIPFMGEPVTVAPLMDRVVIFFSEMILHRVLPAKKERYCFTIWLDGEDTNKDEHSRLKIKAGQSLSEVAKYLASCPAQRIVSRALYKEEYESSLRECMQDGPELAQMIDVHRSHLESVEKHKALSSLVTQLREFAKQ